MLLCVFLFPDSSWIRIASAFKHFEWASLVHWSGMEKASSTSDLRGDQDIVDTVVLEIYKRPVIVALLAVFLVRIVVPLGRLGLQLRRRRREH